MPRLKSNALPSYRLHKQSGQAIVTLSGKDFLLGKHDTPASRQEYERVIAEWIANGRQLPAAPLDMSVAEMVARFWAHAEKTYRNAEGEASSSRESYPFDGARVELPPHVISSTLYNGIDACQHGAG